MPKTPRWWPQAPDDLDAAEGTQAHPAPLPRLFVEQCAIVRATARLLRQSLLGRLGGALMADLTVTWPDQQRVDFSVPVLTSQQAVGGVRYWFGCPRCDRRVGCLYSPAPSEPFWCRWCRGLRYMSQYRRPNDLVRLLKAKGTERWFTGRLRPPGRPRKRTVRATRPVRTGTAQHSGALPYKGPGRRPPAPRRP